MSDQEQQQANPNMGAPGDEIRRLILSDLAHAQRAKRRHFTPALIVTALSAAAMVTVAGVRPDLLGGPGWVLGIHALLWLLCLVALPAVGVGLWFPSRSTRVALVLGAVALTLWTTLGLASGELGGGSLALDHCGVVVLGYGAALVALGVFSGAFQQRSRAAAVYWIAGGVSLTALQTLTFQCPLTGMAHILPNHLGAAGVLMAIAAVAGIWAHRRRRRAA